MTAQPVPPNPSPAQSPPGKPKDDGADTSPYELDAALLTANVRFQDMFAHYLGDRGLVGDPIAIAFAAVYVIEAGGLRIVEPNADRKAES